MSLTVPTGGTTPGGLNSTSGSYPYEWSGNLTILDGHNHTSGSGVQVPTAGLNINATLPMNGYNLSGAGTITCTNLTVSSTFSASSLTATGGTVNCNGLQTLTSGAALTFTTQITSGSGDYALTLNNSNSLTTGDYLVQLLVDTSSVLEIDYLGNVTLTDGGIIAQGKASTSLTLKGNAANSGVGVILDNITAATTGKLLSIRTAGTEKAYFDHVGNLYAAGLSTITSGLVLPLVCQSGASAPAAGCFQMLSGSTTVTSGVLLNVVNKATAELSLDYAGNLTILGSSITPAFTVNSNGHLIPTGSEPAITTTHTQFGTVSGKAVYGGDASFIVSFESGTYGGTPIAANAAIATITLVNAYQSTDATVMVNCIAGTGFVTAAGFFYGYMSSAGVVTIACSVALTPASTTGYEFNVITMGAGASS
jgi:hypothetical protein